MSCSATWKATGGTWNSVKQNGPGSCHRLVVMIVENKSGPSMIFFMRDWWVLDKNGSGGFCHRLISRIEMQKDRCVPDKRRPRC